MKINHFEINEDIYKVMDRLRKQLRQSGSTLLQMDPKESGDYIMIQCPYHKNGMERHPSAQLKKDNGWFYCHNCKENHDFISFLTHCLGENGKSWLIDNFQSVSVENRNVQIFTREEAKPIQYVPKEELDKYRSKHPYMYKRKLTDEIIEKFDIGYDKDFIMEIRDDKGNLIRRRDIGECITFPNKDEHGNILFIARRAINSKFFNYPPDVDKPVYGLYELYEEIKRGKIIREVYIVESMLDALVIWSWGKYAFALNGTGSAYQYNILRNLDIRTYILAFDNDKAGMKARERFKANVTNKFINEIDYKSYNDNKDINEFTEEQFLNANIITMFTR